MKKHISTAIHKILSYLFPYELNERQSVFMQDTWLEKHTRAPFVYDRLSK